MYQWTTVGLDEGRRAASGGEESFSFGTRAYVVVNQMYRRRSWRFDCTIMTYLVQLTGNVIAVLHNYLTSDS